MPTEEFQIFNAGTPWIVFEFKQFLKGFVRFISFDYLCIEKQVPDYVR